MNISGKKYLLILGCAFAYTAILCYACDRELTEADLTFDLAAIPYTISVESDGLFSEIVPTPEDESIATNSQSPLVTYFDNDLFDDSDQV